MPPRTRWISAILLLVSLTLVAIAIANRGAQAQRAPETLPMRAFIPLTLRTGPAEPGDLQLVGQLRLTDHHSGLMDFGLLLVDGGRTAYVGRFLEESDQARIDVVDLTHPQTPTIVGQSEPIPYINGSWRGMSLRLLDGPDDPDDVALVAASTAGLRTLDISDPSRPKWLGHLPTSLDALDVGRTSDHAVLFEGSHSDLSRDDPGYEERIHVLDVRDASTPRIVHSSRGRTLAEGNVLDRMAVADDTVYVVGDRSGIVAYQVGHSRAITRRAAFEIGAVRDALWHQGQLYVANVGRPSYRPQGIWSLRHPSPEVIVSLDRLRPSPGDTWSGLERIAAYGPRVYAAAVNREREGYAPGALYAIDITNPNAMAVTASIGAPSGGFRRIYAMEAYDDLIVMAADRHLYIYRFSGP